MPEEKEINELQLAETEITKYLQEFNVVGIKGKSVTDLPCTKMDFTNQPSSKMNQLFHMKPKERSALINEYSGIDKIILERLVRKVGDEQYSNAGYIYSSSAYGFVSLFPIAGLAVSISLNAEISDLKMKLERSFSAHEVKQILSKELSEFRSKTYGFKKTINTTMKNWEEEKVRLETEIAKHRLTIGKLKTKIANYEQIKRGFVEEKSKKKIKPIRSWEAVDLEQAKTLLKEYEAEIKDWEEQFDDMLVVKRIFEIDIDVLKIQIESLEWEKENLEKKRENEVELVNVRAEYWQRNSEIEVEERNKLKVEFEEQRQKLLAAWKERDELKASMAPRWLQKTFHRIDWAFETDLQNDVNSFWSKSKAYGRFSLVILVACYFALIGSWILKVLVKVGRNIKAIFTKKQDTASILKDLLGGMKQAKEKVIEVLPEPPKKAVRKVRKIKLKKINGSK